MPKSPSDAYGHIRAFVFDNNGTALNDLPVAYGSVEAIFAVLGLPCPSKDEYRNEICANYMEFYWNHGVPRDITGDQLNIVRKLYYRMHQDYLHYRSDFEPFLWVCRERKIPVAMCSAEIQDVLVGFLQRAGLYPLFGSGMVRGGAWPSKAPVLVAIAKDIGLLPMECAYVDDTADGIAAAKEAGFYSIGFAHPTGYNSAKLIRAAKPNLVVTSFTNLRKQLDFLTIRR